MTLIYSRSRMPLSDQWTQRHKYITPMLRDLHWLPVWRVHFKLVLLVNKPLYMVWGGGVPRRQSLRRSGLATLPSVWIQTTAECLLVYGCCYGGTLRRTFDHTALCIYCINLTCWCVCCAYRCWFTKTAVYRCCFYVPWISGDVCRVWYNSSLSLVVICLTLSLNMSFCPLCRCPASAVLWHSCFDDCQTYNGV